MKPIPQIRVWQVGGVKSVSLDLETKVLNIAYIDGKTNPDVLRKRVTVVGYNADSLKRDPAAYENLMIAVKTEERILPPQRKKGVVNNLLNIKIHKGSSWSRILFYAYVTNVTKSKTICSLLLEILWIPTTKFKTLSIKVFC